MEKEEIVEEKIAVNKARLNLLEHLIGMQEGFKAYWKLIGTHPNPEILAAIETIAEKYDQPGPNPKDKNTTVEILSRNAVATLQDGNWETIEFAFATLVKYLNKCSPTHFTLPYIFNLSLQEQIRSGNIKQNRLAKLLKFPQFINLINKKEIAAHCQQMLTKTSEIVEALDANYNPINLIVSLCLTISLYATEKDNAIPETRLLQISNLLAKIISEVTQLTPDKEYQIQPIVSENIKILIKEIENEIGLRHGKLHDTLQKFLQNLEASPDKLLENSEIKLNLTDLKNSFRYLQNNAGNIKNNSVFFLQVKHYITNLAAFIASPSQNPQLSTCKSILLAAKVEPTHWQNIFNNLIATIQNYITFRTKDGATLKPDRIELITKILKNILQDITSLTTDRKDLNLIILKIIDKHRSYGFRGELKSRLEKFAKTNLSEANMKQAEQTKVYHESLLPIQNQFKQLLEGETPFATTIKNSLQDLQSIFKLQAIASADNSNSGVMSDAQESLFEL